MYVGVDPSDLTQYLGPTPPGQGHHGRSRCGVDGKLAGLPTAISRGRSPRFESLILSHHSRFKCECNKEDINDDDEWSPVVMP